MDILIVILQIIVLLGAIYLGVKIGGIQLSLRKRSHKAFNIGIAVEKQIADYIDSDKMHICAVQRDIGFKSRKILVNIQLELFLGS